MTPLAVTALAAVGLMAAGCGVDRGDYERENVRILNALPVPAGAQRLDLTTGGIRRPDCETFCGGYVGYSTTATYGVPQGFEPEDMRDFYVEHMPPEWTYTEWRPEYVDVATGERGFTGAYVLTFRRGDTEVAIAAGEEVTDAPGFSIRVDHDAGARTEDW